MKGATLSNEDGTADEKEPDTKAPVDAAFLKFQERLRNEPDQVLRYGFLLAKTPSVKLNVHLRMRRYHYRDTEKQAEPLWVSDEGKPESMAPCTCGAPRNCEFQVDLLLYLNRSRR